MANSRASKTGGAFLIQVALLSVAIPFLASGCGAQVKEETKSCENSQLGKFHGWSTYLETRAGSGSELLIGGCDNSGEPRQVNGTGVSSRLIQDLVATNICSAQEPNKGVNNDFKCFYRNVAWNLAVSSDGTLQSTFWAEKL